MNSSNVSLTFLGGAGTVTGSKTLVESGEHKVLVDAGLFQGIKNLRVKNWSKFQESESSIGHVLLTHAHLDHSGYLPVLVRNGFKGKIHCTPASKRLAELILLDSAKIQEEDAEEANKGQYTAHKPAKPLYTAEDVKKCMELFETHQYGEWVILNEEFKFSMHNAGHIAGSAWIELRVAGKKIVFSGDLGRSKPLLLFPPHRCEEADYVVMESTYGGRAHSETDPKEELQHIITSTLSKGGQVLIPAFAVERTQEILFLLGELLHEKAIPHVPIYIDSPMALSATEIFMDFEFRREIPDEIMSELSKQVIGVRSAGSSKKIVNDPELKIVIAGSGMLSGGRMLHYLEKHLGDYNSSVILTGYQAEGTRGRKLLQGMPELKFFGKYHRVKASVHRIRNLSAHADQKELLLWLNRISKKPKRIFLNHGEPMASDNLRVRIQDQFDIACEVVEEGKKYLI